MEFCHFSGLLVSVTNGTTAQNFADEENGLYGQSALFVFGQFLEENNAAMMTVSK